MDYVEVYNFKYDASYFDFAEEMVDAMESRSVDAIVLGNISNQNILPLLSFFECLTTQLLALLYLLLVEILR